MDNHSFKTSCLKNETVSIIIERRNMPTLIHAPIRIEATGNKPKIIEEYVGRVASKTQQISMAHMQSPAGWIEPG